MQRNDLLPLFDLTYEVIEDWSSGQCVDANHGVFDCYADLFIVCSQFHYSAQWWDWTRCSFQNMPNHTIQPGKTPWTNTTFSAQLHECATQANMSFDILESCAFGPVGAARAHASSDRSQKRNPEQPLPHWCDVDGVAVSNGPEGNHTTSKCRISTNISQC
jgi:hypothetical protein